MTHSSCGEDVSLERFEILGDSFLKYASAVHLFTAFPDKSEGFLVRHQHIMVSNKLFIRHARRLGLEKCVTGLVWRRRRRPRLAPKRTHRVFVSGSDVTAAVLAIRRYIRAANFYSQPSRSERGVLRTELLQQKAIADLVEALVGAVYCMLGDSAAWDFIRRLGVLEGHYGEGSDGIVVHETVEKQIRHYCATVWEGVPLLGVAGLCCCADLLARSSPSPLLAHSGAVGGVVRSSNISPHTSISHRLRLLPAPLPAPPTLHLFALISQRLARGLRPRTGRPCRH